MSSNIKKIFLIQWTNNIGGLENVTLSIQNKLGESYKVSVVVLKHNANGVEYKNLVTNKFKSIGIYPWYFLFVFKNKRSVFHLNNATLKILFLTKLAGASNIIYHYHGTKFGKSWFDKIIWNNLFNKTKIIVNSTYVSELVSKNFNLNTNIHIIPNLIDFTKFEYIKKKPSEKFIITYAGRFSKGKNIDKIISVAKIITKNNKDIIFELYGDGPEKRKIEDLIRYNKLEDYVNNYGFTNQIQEAYKKSNLFLFLSSYESFGNIVAESILSGTPIICLRIPALKDLIIEDDFFVDTLNEKNIAEKILFVKDNYSKFLEKTNNNYNYLVKYLDNDNNINDLISIYSKRNK